MRFFLVHSLKLTFSRLKIGLPNWKLIFQHLTTIHFQVRTVSFREGNLLGKSVTSVSFLAYFVQHIVFSDDYRY